jgi:hypothetical protein
VSSRAQRTHPLLLLHPAASPAISPAAGARHLTVDRPSQAPSSQIDPTTVIPYPHPCLATTPPSHKWGPGGEQLRTSPAVGLDQFPPRHPLLAPSASPSLWHMGPHHPRTIPSLAGQVGRLPTRPRSAGPKSPPAQLSEGIPPDPVYILIFYAPKIV